MVTNYIATTDIMALITSVNSINNILCSFVKKHGVNIDIYTGVCKEICVTNTTVPECSIDREQICIIDDDCPEGFCYNSYCYNGCSRGDEQCSTLGFTCQQDVCLKLCDETGWFASLLFLYSQIC